MKTSCRFHVLLTLLLGLGSTLPAAAFSLSEPQLRSRLGQRLDLRLELTHAANEQPSVQLAGHEEYARQGFEPPSRQMGDLSIEVEALGDGRGQVRVRSTNRVTEPILTLLIEVREGNTRLVREITTFVDPPNGAPSAGPAAVAVAAAPVAPLPAVLQNLALDAALSTPERAPSRHERRRSERAPAANPETTQAAAAIGAPSPEPALSSLRLDERYRGDSGSARLSPKTTAWLQREHGASAKEPGTPLPAAPAEPVPASAAKPALAQPSAPEPWGSFLIMLGAAAAILWYARRLRLRLMREALTKLEIEKTPAPA